MRPSLAHDLWRDLFALLQAVRNFASTVAAVELPEVGRTVALRKGRE